MLQCKNTGYNQDLLHSMARTAPAFVAQVMQEGAQMKGFLSGFILMGISLQFFILPPRCWSNPQPYSNLQESLCSEIPVFQCHTTASWSLKPSGKFKEWFILKFFSIRTFLVQFGSVFKGRFSHPLTFLGAGANKNPHFHRIPKKCWSIMNHSGHPALSLECQCCPGRWRDLNGSGSRGTFPVINPYPEGRAGDFSQRGNFILQLQKGGKEFLLGLCN